MDARSGGSACQSASLTAITITNDGTATADIDLNTSAAMDANTWLKIWMSDGPGCGASGLGGWSQLCTVVGTTNPVTSTTCKDFNSSNSTVKSRITSALGVGDSNSLCASGELQGPQLDAAGATTQVAAGDHNATIQIYAD